MPKNIEKPTKVKYSSKKNVKKNSEKKINNKKKIVLDIDSIKEKQIPKTTIRDKKQISNKKTNKKENDEFDFENKFEEIREALRENYSQQKKLMNDMKELMALHKKEIKLSTKSCNRSNSGKHTGFNKPEPVPPSLKKLLKIREDMLPRSKITRLMYQYFTDNKMYNINTKKEIIPNEKIKEIFDMQDGDVITFYNLQTWLKKVYNKNSTNNDNILEVEN